MSEFYALFKYMLTTFSSGNNMCGMEEVIRKCLCDGLYVVLLI